MIVPVEVLALICIAMILICAGILVAWLHHQALPKEAEKFWEGQ